MQVVDAADPANIQLRIHEDPFCESDGRAHFQWVAQPSPKALQAELDQYSLALCLFQPCRWFHFRLTGGEGVELTLKLINAGEASFANAWSGYNTCASYDRQHWFRVPTSYDKSSGVLSIQHKPDKVWMSLIATMNANVWVSGLHVSHMTALLHDCLVGGRDL